jgi:hypothetical protein
MYDDWELLKATPVTTGDGFGWPAEARPAIAAAAVRNSIMRRQAERAVLQAALLHSACGALLLSAVMLFRRGRVKQSSPCSAVRGQIRTEAIIRSTKYGWIYI